MNAEDHARLCPGVDGPVVESLDALYRAFRCDQCGRTVVEWENEAGAEAGSASRPEKRAA